MTKDIEPGECAQCHKALSLDPELEWPDDPNRILCSECMSDQFLDLLDARRDAQEKLGQLRQSITGYWIQHILLKRQADALIEMVDQAIDILENYQDAPK